MLLIVFYILLILNCIIDGSYVWRVFSYKFQLRRGKINERLKCLQDIVPGCYKVVMRNLNQTIFKKKILIASYWLFLFGDKKAVGMATMLDEIINYVQSLQNQVEV